MRTLATPLGFRPFAFFLFFALSLSSARPADSGYLIYIGTDSRGIYAVRLNNDTGALSTPEFVAETASPTFLALHPNRRVLYTANDEGIVEGKPGGAVSAYALNPANGHLTLLNEQTTGGISLIHLAPDATGRMLVAVSFRGSYTIAFPLESDGRLGPRMNFIQYQGPLGPLSREPEIPHPHSVTIAPDNRFALVADAGLDRVLSYRLDAAQTTLTPVDPPFITIARGAEPRHSKFSKDGRFFYVLGQGDKTITACAYDAARGSVEPFQHISTLPADVEVPNPGKSAEIRVHPNGKFVYASNRGHDSIAVFAADAASGRLTPVEYVPSGGKSPRHFAFSPGGDWLVCVHQNSNTVVTFRVDPATGRLTPVGSPVTIPMPTCVLFVD